MSIVYAREQNLGAEDYIAVVGSTTMRERRPLQNPARVARMLSGSNFIVTARDADGTIVGLARGVSDGEWVCYLADLAVRDLYQGQGIGSAILEESKRILGPGMGIVLVAYPEAEKFYRRIGLGEMTGFYLDRQIRT